jgi:hypothetical protein
MPGAIVAGKSTRTVPLAKVYEPHGNIEGVVHWEGLLIWQTVERASSIPL